ncbi:unnamed protein product, partial [Tetraodon nigroviridis]
PVCQQLLLALWLGIYHPSSLRRGEGEQIKKGDNVQKDKVKGRDRSVFFMDPHLAFISPALHKFLTLIYEWDSITLMPSINCSRFLSFVPLQCVIVQSSSYIKEK